MYYFSDAPRRTDGKNMQRNCEQQVHFMWTTFNLSRLSFLFCGFPLLLFLLQRPCRDQLSFNLDLADGCKNRVFTGPVRVFLHGIGYVVSRKPKIDPEGSPAPSVFRPCHG